LKGLYIHIPFCESICHYCDFVKRIPKNQSMIDDYLTHLIDEINQYQDHFPSIDTIYIGGGTPSMLSLTQLRRLFEVLKDISPKEYTIEVNPESYSTEKGKLFKSYGVNRISLGVQTFHSNLLTYMNRKHSNNQVFNAINDLRNHGIDNISIDLIYAIPGQTIDDLKKDLKIVNDLAIKHISCYALILEEKTFFYHQFINHKFSELDDDLQLEMYELIIKTLNTQGFKHYEISNFAKTGYESKHNSIYWKLDEYIGCGLGAHGFINQMRTVNHHLLTTYITSPRKEEKFQEESDLLQDTLIFGLRMLDGICVTNIEKKYKISLMNKYPKLIEFIDLGYLSYENDILKLTEKGLFVSNQIFMEFI
jgi:oxygen-independent coproporphyrinogen III oxidase